MKKTRIAMPLHTTWRAPGVASPVRQVCALFTVLYTLINTMTSWTWGGRKTSLSDEQLPHGARDHLARENLTSRYGGAQAIAVLYQTFESCPIFS